MSDATPRPPMDPADQRYLAKDWRGALDRYERALRDDPEQAIERSLPLLVAHCRLELADPIGLDIAPDLPAPTGSGRELFALKMLRARALELCRAGDVERAAALLRLSAVYDTTMAAAYRTSFAPGRSAASRRLPADDEPPFIRELGIGALPVAALKRQHRGERLLLVYRRFFTEGGNRQGEPVTALATTAARFGLVPTIFALHDADPTALAPAVLRAVLDTRPEVIVYDPHVAEARSPEPDLAREQIESVLDMARRDLGIRVVVSYTDAWEPALHGSDALYRGVGSVFDLVQHGYAAAHGIGSPDQNARTFCYVLPAWLPATPSVTPCAVPRAGFAGSIAWFNYMRLAWWVESARCGLPVDFHETLHHEGEPRSDQDYVDLLARYQLSLNFTARTDGIKIMTGRSLDVPLAGGVLLEEHTPNTDFFMTPHVHYIPFETIDDLAALIPELLADPERRAAVAAAGRRWVETYFTGDHFWAGMLARLDALR